jgi:O-antigen/teichoic acid export membrane protein
MSTDTLESQPVTAESHKSKFFRQSGWMMIATVVSGVFMAFINIFSSKVLAAGEYGSFAALLQMVNQMGIPAVGLQMVFAQQTSAVIADHQRRQLVATTKAVMRWTFGVWLVMALVAFLCHQRLIAALSLSNPMSLWLTIIVGFVMLWFPILQGLLQGRQNFLWLGWTALFNGVGRVAIGLSIVYFFHGQAAGLMLGVLIGLLAALLTSMIQNRDLFAEPSDPFDAAGWLKRVVPLTLGLGASQFLFSEDALVVQNYFGAGGASAPYLFGGTLARAIVLFTGPLAVVMFPKLVHSAARSQKTDLMGVTLVGTAVLSGVAVLGLVVTAPLVTKYGSTQANAAILPLLPLFASAMVPFGMANVLLYNLMAHSRFKIVPAMLVLAVGYWFALQHFHDSFKMVIETFGAFSVIYLALCAVFNWLVD